MSPPLSVIPRLQPQADDFSGFPFALSVLHPPYDREQPVASLRTLARGSFPAGSVLVVTLGGATADLRTLERWMQRLRASLSTVSFVLRVGRDPAMVAVAFHAARMGFRGVLPDGVPVAETLRAFLTRPADLPHDVVEWLGVRGVRITPRVGHVVRQIFHHAPRYAKVSETLRVIRSPETSTRLQFRQKRLPPPSHWHRTARALQAALQIQAEPDESLLLLALRLGYADHSTLSQQINRAFGLRPNAIRGTLGWEWLVDRWVRHAFREAPVAAGLAA